MLKKIKSSRNFYYNNFLCYSFFSYTTRFLWINSKSFSAAIRRTWTGACDRWHLVHWRQRLEGAHSPKTLYGRDVTGKMVLAGGRIVLVGDACPSPTVCDGLVTGTSSRIPCSPGFNGCCGTTPLHDTLDRRCAHPKSTQGAHML